MKKIFFIIFCYISSLNALSLEETINKALQNNLSLKKNYLDKSKLEQQKYINKNKKFGNIILNINYDHYNNSRTLAPLTPMDLASSPTGSYQMATTNDLISTGVNYNVILFDGFANSKTYKISDLSYKISDLKIKLAKEELIYNIRTLYLSLLSLEEQLKSQQDYIKYNKKLLEYTTLEYKLGSKSKIDVLESKNSFINAVSNKDKINANINILKATISMLIGVEKFEKAEPINISLKNEDFEENEIKNLSRLKIVENSKNIARKKIDIAKSFYYPKVEFSSYYGYNSGPNSTTNTFPTTGVTYLEKGDWNSENIWQVGIHIKWNIFDFGVKKANLEKEKISLLQSNIDIENTRLELDKNLKIAQNKLSIAKSNYYSLKSQYDLLKEINKVQYIKYKNNALSITDLLDTETKKELAYSKMIDAKYQYQKAVYYIEYILEKGEK